MDIIIRQLRMNKCNTDEETPDGTGAPWTRPLQETIIWDEMGRKPARTQEIALGHIAECCAAIRVGEMLGEEAMIQQTEVSPVWVEFRWYRGIAWKELDCDQC
jgi:hypothetical protein